MPNEISAGTNNINSGADIVRLQYLDALRGIAALLILAVHLTVIINLFNGYKFGLGTYGVQLFYILSALTLLLSSSQRFAVETRPVFNFFVRRFFRIAPLFYLVVIAALLFSQGVTYRLPNGQIYLDNIVAHFLFIFGFSKYWVNSLIGVEWSIACEVWFYLSLPLVFKYIKTKKQSLWLLLTSLAVSLLFQKLLSSFFNKGHDPLLSEWTSFFILSNYFYFALGIVLYFILKDKKPCKPICLYLGWAAFFGGLIFIIKFNFIHFSSLGISLLIWLLVFLMSHDLPINFIFNNAITRLLGRVSYSIYLWHFLILGWLAKLVINPYLVFFSRNLMTRASAILGSTLIVILASYASYNLIEKPGIKLGKYIIRKMAMVSK